MGDSDTQNKKEQREKNRRSIKIKVPSIGIGKHSNSSAQQDKAKKTIKKPEITKKTSTPAKPPVLKLM